MKAALLVGAGYVSMAAAASVSPLTNRGPAEQATSEEVVPWNTLDMGVLLQQLSVKPLQRGVVGTSSAEMLAENLGDVFKGPLKEILEKLDIAGLMEACKAAGGEKPGEGGKPAEGEKPGEGGKPAEGEKPGEGGKPAEGEKPGEGGKPAEGEKPGEGGKPAEGEKPGEGGKAGEGGKPTEGGKPGEGGKPAEGGKPGEGEKPAEGGKPGEGEKAGEGGKPAEGEKASEGGAAAEGLRQEAQLGANTVKSSSHRLSFSYSFLFSSAAMLVLLA